MKENFSKSNEFSKYDLKKLGMKFVQAVVVSIVGVIITFIPEVQDVLLSMVGNEESLKAFAVPVSLMINWITDTVKTYLKDYTNAR